MKNGKYFISTWPRADGSHTVHREGCPFISQKERHLFLGHYNSIQEAIDEGNKYYKPTGICIFCLKDHSGIKQMILTGGRLTTAALSPHQIKDNTNENVLVCCIN